jgi:5-methyltetrahydropteroyltriglutamate--homocysteine methyltransferase
LTEFKVSLTGVHARNESTIQATQDWERGRIDSLLLRAAFKDDTESLVRLQQEVGTDYLSDGQITIAWQDFLRPITSGFSGVKKGAMVRWYNTNTFYQTPIVNGEIGSSGHGIWSKIERRFVRKGKFRIALPDPLTFSELAEDTHYHNPEKVLFAYAEALNGEIKTLEKNGVDYVQFSSPALVARFTGGPLQKDRLNQLGEAIRTSTKGTSLHTGFQTFFGDASPYLPEIFDAIPTNDIGFDFTQTDPEALTSTKKGIIAGVADARSTYLESVDELREKVEQVVDRTGSPSITLAPSSDLRYIPRVSADEKLKQLGALKRALRGK